MILFSHIVIALSSLLLTSFAFVFPSLTKLQVASTLFLATLVSGTYLVWLNPTHLTQTCITGLAYSGIMLVGLFSTRHKLTIKKYARS